ncbi:hypothetical protein PISMIDRAFT_348653 [Pisolithus microcarpus 441]|uniref:Uncharacterized protein n=1 Tax=Pisolithus microcarpus 441 TaxID=765257 RepID=A0A0C9YK08_9AGAM|nr:hypothetical protein PISMIDRAFT_348653 [Pisolithus microcarpus 441]
MHRHCSYFARIPKVWVFDRHVAPQRASHNRDKPSGACYETSSTGFQTAMLQTEPANKSRGWVAVRFPRPCVLGFLSDT